MKIVVTGIPGSGDIWLFNAVRLICESHGPTYATTFDRYLPFYFEKDYDFEVVKVVEFHQSVADQHLIVTTTRKPQEMQLPETEKINYLYDHARWCAYANGVISYDDIVEDPLQAVADVAFSIDLHADPKSILSQLQEIKPPARGEDPKTLYFSTYKL